MSFTYRRRDLGVAVAARAVSLLGDEVATIALVLRLQAHGAGAGAVAALMIANLAPIVLLTGVVGRLVDRRDNRALLVTAGLAQAVVCSALAFTDGRAAVLALVFLLGVGQAVTGTTWQALLPSLVAPAGLARAVGLAQAAGTVAAMTAPALGGVLWGLAGARVPLLIDTATFLALALGGFLVGRRRVVSAPAAGERLRGGLSIVRRAPLLRAVLILLGASVLLGSLVNIVEVFLVRETLHASALWFGFAGAAYAVGMCGGALAARRLTTVRRQGRWFVVSVGGLSLGLVAMGLAPDVGWLLAFAALTGTGNGVLNVCTGALVLGGADPAERGRVAALLTGVASGGQLVAFAASGALAAVLSPRAIFVAAGLVGVLGPLLFGRAVLRAAARPAGTCLPDALLCSP